LSTDEYVGTVSSLTSLVKDIIEEEAKRRRAHELPEQAAVPVMKRKTLKELGTPTVQASEMSDTIKEISPDELLEMARRKRAALEQEGQLDTTGDQQPPRPPKLDDDLVGTEVEVNWRYWTVCPETGARKSTLIWCTGEVVQVANGTTDKESPRCRKFLKAGAVRIRWPADDVFEEEETFVWSILTEANWNADRHMGWRFSAAELKKRGV